MAVSGDARVEAAAEAPEHLAKLCTEVAFATDEVSRGQKCGLDVVAAVVLPQMEQD
jgi:hypothetical protein